VPDPQSGILNPLVYRLQARHVGECRERVRQEHSGSCAVIVGDIRTRKVVVSQGFLLELAARTVKRRQFGS
jgi:hypothetical protein